MKKRLVFLILGLLFSAQMISAQQPEVIDVKSYTIYKEANWTSAQFNMTAVNSSGSPVSYGGTGNYVIPALMSCSPCNLPNAFNTNGFFSSGAGVSFNWAFDSPVQLIVTSVETEPIVLRPTISRKKQRIKTSGAVSVRGRLEIRSPAGLLAVDNDVNLAGTYSTEFIPLISLPGRKIMYTSISYTLHQVP